MPVPDPVSVRRAGRADSGRTRGVGYLSRGRPVPLPGATHSPPATETTVAA